MPGVSQSILIQSLASLLQHCIRVDVRVLMHEAACRAGADPLLDMARVKFRAYANACLKRAAKANLLRIEQGAVALTDKGWQKSGLARPSKVQGAQLSVPRDLKDRVRKWLQHADYRTVRLADFCLSVFRDTPPRVFTSADIARVMQVVRASLGTSVTFMPHGRIRQNLVEEVRSPLLLSPASFRDPIIRAMAVQGGGKPEQPLLKNLIIEEAFRCLGIDSLDQDAKKLSARVLRGMVVGGTRLVEAASPKLWVLTPDGARRAIPLMQDVPALLLRKADANLTAKWIREHDGKGLRVEVAKKIIRKCPISNRIGAIDDHVQEFFTRLIHRDALRSRLESGQSIPYSLVASWGVRSAFVDIRNAGTNPICREQHGARTEKEVKEMRASGDGAPQLSRKPSITLLSNLPSADVSTHDVEETIWFNQFWAKFEGIVRARFPGDAELYMQVLRAKLNEDSVSAIADSVGVNERRVRAILKNVGGLRSAAFSED